jgi:hypothetical protein
MNKLVLALATAAAFGLSTAAFAQNPTAWTTTASMQAHNQVPQATKPVAHKTRAHNGYRGYKAVMAHHHKRHHRLWQARRHGNGKKVFVKSAPASTTPKTKASS